MPEKQYIVFVTQRLFESWLGGQCNNCLLVGFRFSQEKSTRFFNFCSYPANTINSLFANSFFCSKPHLKELDYIMIFTRERYIKQLDQADGDGLIKIVSGLRRCGKSYLLNNLFYNHLLTKGINRNHIIKIALDDLMFSNLLSSPKVFYDYVISKMTDNGKYYVLIDEVQLLNGFEKVLNSFLHISNLEVYVTGSNSKFLTSDIVSEFRGRGHEIRLYPLSFNEVLSEEKKTMTIPFHNIYCMVGFLFRS